MGPENKNASTVERDKKFRRDQIRAKKVIYILEVEKEPETEFSSFYDDIATELNELVNEMHARVAVELVNNLSILARKRLDYLSSVYGLNEAFMNIYRQKYPRMKRN